MAYNFEVPVGGNEYIFWLKVPVDDEPGVHGFNSWEYFNEVVFYQIHWHGLMSVDSLNEFGQAASRRVLKYVVEISFILESEELLNYIRMVERS